MESRLNESGEPASAEIPLHVAFHSRPARSARAWNRRRVMTVYQAEPGSADDSALGRLAAR
jgi:hypothetical protein